MSLKLKSFDDFQMYLIAEDKGISAALLKPGGDKVRERAFMTLLKREITPGIVACDIGANIGFVTLTIASLMQGKGKVLAIEPDPQNFKVLGKNIKLNKLQHLVKAINLGVSNSNGNATFYRSAMSNLGGMIQTKHTTKATEVEIKTITQIMKEQKLVPNLYKMDIEGFEVEALEGMLEHFKQNKNEQVKILMEVHPTLYTKKRSLERSLRALLEQGFRFKALISAGTPNPDAFNKLGYKIPDEVYDCGWKRGVYYNVDSEHALYLTCRCHNQAIQSKTGKMKTSPKAVRAVLLERNS